MIGNLNKLFHPLEITELNYVSGDFFPHVEIRNGKIYFDDEVEDACLLHEIGHLALLPSHIRKRINGDVELAETADQALEPYFTGNEDHLIVWQKRVTDQLHLSLEAQYLERSDAQCYYNIDREAVIELFNVLEMGFDSVSGTFEKVVSPL